MPQITLKAARVNANLSQKEAAKTLNVAPSTLRNWESGKTFPRQDQIVAMCELYNVAFDNIFFANKLAIS